jgi:hypothetical protein
MNSDKAHRIVERTARESYGRPVAFLVARTRDVASATRWQKHSLPRSNSGRPEAYGLRVRRLPRMNSLRAAGARKPLRSFSSVLDNFSAAELADSLRGALNLNAHVRQPA